MIRISKKSAGFTIIELMIVLAIAGIILLLVFLAVPALQRGSRNYDRKNVVGLTTSAMEDYKNNHAAYPVSPAEICDFLDHYLQEAAGPPDASCTPSFAGDCITVHYERYDVCYHDHLTTPHSYLGDDTEVSIILSHWCNTGDNYWPGDGSNPITSGGIPIDNQLGRYVVWIRMEHAPPQCIDNFPNHS